MGITYEQSADNTEIVFRDASNGWNTETDPDFSDIDTATITITVGVVVNTIDVIAVFTAATVENDLVFTIDNGDLGGVAGEVITDSISLLDYSVDDGGAGPWAITQEVIPIVGVIRNYLYDEMRLAPHEVEILDELVNYREQDWENVLDPLFNYVQYKALWVDTSLSQETLIENIFTVLQNRLTP